MKKLAILFIALFCTVPLMAQHHGHHNHADGNPNVPKVEELVSDLSAMQKKRLENVTNASKKKVMKLKSELAATREQIRILMDKDGDMSSTIFPLVDKEAQLQAEITKEMYRCRQSIDEILTKEQLKEFRSQLKSNFENGQPRNHHRKMVKAPAKNPTAPNSNKCAKAAKPASH